MKKLHRNMFTITGLRFRLWRLRNRSGAFKRQYAIDLAKAHTEKKSGDEIEQIKADWHMEFELLREEIGDIKTFLIIREGDKYNVHVPIQRGNFGVWEEGHAYTDRYLTDSAIADMRSQIRQEKRERWEEWTRWIPLLSAFTGLIGAATGLIALLVKLK